MDTSLYSAADRYEQLVEETRKRLREATVRVDLDGRFYYQNVGARHRFLQACEAGIAESESAARRQMLAEAAAREAQRQEGMQHTQSVRQKTIRGIMDHYLASGAVALYRRGRR